MSDHTPTERDEVAAEGYESHRNSPRSAEQGAAVPEGRRDGERLSGPEMGDQ